MTSPAGSISLAQEYLRVTLANSARFRTWTDTIESEQGALAKIHHEALPPAANNAAQHTVAELETYRPYAIVSTDQEAEGFSVVRDAMGSWKESGKLTLELCEDVPSNLLANLFEARLLFKNTVGVIIDEMRALADQAGKLNFTGIVLAGGPWFSSEDVASGQGVFQWIDLSVVW